MQKAGLEACGLLSTAFSVPWRTQILWERHLRSIRITTYFCVGLPGRFLKQLGKSVFIPGLISMLDSLRAQSRAWAKHLAIPP